MNFAQVFPWVLSCCSLLIAYLTFNRNGAKDRDAEREKSDQKIDSIKESILKANMKLDQVCATTNETRTDIKSMDAKIQRLDTEVEVVKRDLKTAFSRIDDLSKRGE